jgi:hypothetical protein
MSPTVLQKQESHRHRNLLSQPLVLQHKVLRHRSLLSQPSALQHKVQRLLKLHQQALAEMVAGTVAGTSVGLVQPLLSSQAALKVSNP